MTYVQYGLVAAADYNSRETLVENVWGTGSGSYGWGQPALSSVTVGGTVTAGLTTNPEQWGTLIQTLNNISTHEVGGATSITPPITGNIVAWLNQLDTTINQLCDTGATNNRFGNYTQFSDLAPVRGSYSQPWNATLGTTATITWANANAARYFFNAGGRINITISYNGGSGTPQDNNWATLCANAGTMWLQAQSVGGTASGSCGYYQSPGRMYSASGSGAYSSNTLTVDVAGQGTNSLSFAINLNDNHTNVWADNVTGVFTVTVLVRNPTMNGMAINSWGQPNIVVPNFVASSTPAVPTPGGGGGTSGGGGQPSSITFYGQARNPINPQNVNLFWTVPSGVSSVCVIMISGGGGGGAATSTRNGQGGGGGSMLWVNDIPVAPGDVFMLVGLYAGHPALSGEGAGDRGGGVLLNINNGAKGTLLIAGGEGGSSGSIDPSLGKGSSFYQIDGFPQGYGTFGFQKGGDGGLGSPNANQRGGGGGGAAGYSGSGGNGASWTTTAIQPTAGQGGGGGGGAFTGTVGTAGYVPLGGSGGGVGYLGQTTNGAAGGGGGSAHGSGSHGFAGGTNGNQVNYGRDLSYTDPRDNTQFYNGGLFGGGGAGGVLDLSAFPNLDYNPGNGMWGAPGIVRIIWGSNRAYPTLNVGTP